MYASEMSCPAAFAAPLEKALPLLVAFALMFAPLVNLPLLAQGLESEEAIDAIIGSDVKTEEAGNGNETERVVTAIENTLQSAESVRKAFSLDTLEIVFLPQEEVQGGPISEAIEEHENEIETLRQSIEGSAMFYHAVDSRSILLRDIVAAQFHEDNTVTVFAISREQ